MQIDTRGDYLQFEISENFPAFIQRNHTKCSATSLFPADT
jgi:hypothetical protein